ncbi:MULTISPECIES: hypothetical protein [Saccharothrix]|uniref:hypothetical protein n=1 Tax=Saccharothrix TaxID=2071 RepID=UPI0009639A04|nr:hypothetical protein A6A25_14180 [Saccharothrix sp. CB00851]
MDLLVEAIADRQEVPADPIPVELEDVTVELTAEIAARARARARDAGLKHNEARPVFRRALVDALVAPALDLIGEDWPELAADVRRELTGHPDVRRAVDRLWPLLTPQRLLADLYAGRCFGLGHPELHRDDPRAWTVSDVPLLDEAAELLGSDGRAERRAAEEERRQAVEYAQGVLHVIDSDAEMYEEDLRAVDLVNAEWLADRHTTADHRVTAERAAADREWTYGHIVVDEAQELSEMDWRVLARRGPNRSMTIVGDLAQRQSAAGARDWSRVLAPLARDRWQYRRLTVNYRTPAEIMAYAADTLAEVDPTAVPPTSVRHGEPPLEVTAADPESFRPATGTFAVITPTGPLTPRATKGLEFDTVVVVDPERMAPAERYVALTRATQRMIVVRTSPPRAETGRSS